MLNSVIYKKITKTFKFIIDKGFLETHRIIPKGVIVDYQKNYESITIRANISFENYEERKCTMSFSVHNHIDSETYEYPKDFYGCYLLLPQCFLIVDKYKIMKIHSEGKEYSNLSILNEISDKVKSIVNCMDVKAYKEMYNNYESTPINYEIIVQAAILARSNIDLLEKALVEIIK